jgi:hypothetical protein
MKKYTVNDPDEELAILTLEVPKEFAIFLRIEASRRNISRSQLVREILKKYFSENEVVPSNKPK